MRLVDTVRNVKDLAGGDEFLLWGQPHRWRHPSGDPARVAAWYQAEGQRWLDARWPDMAARVGVEPGLSVTVRGFVRGRGVGTWGTYRRTPHAISIAWPIFQLPEELVEAVLAHEVAHAARPGGASHGPAWQAVYSRLVPGWRVLARRVQVEGRSVWLGDVAG